MRFLFILSFILILLSCDLPELNKVKMMGEQDLNLINKNELSEMEINGKGFLILSISKNSKNLKNGTSITNSSDIPIIVAFTNGKISSAQDIDIKIYEIETNGERLSNINIISNKIVNLNSKSELYLYTETLKTNTTYELLITAKNTKNSYGIKLNNDNDSISGEDEDDFIIRFSTGAPVNKKLMPNPLDLINVPVLNPGNINRGVATTNTLTDTTNGSAIDVENLTDAIKLFNITESKFYQINIKYESSNTYLIIEYPDTLPFGAYKLTVDKTKFKESSKINGYIHRGSYTYYDIPLQYNFLIRSTNITFISLSITNYDKQVAKINCNYDLDLSTLNSNTVKVIEDGLSYNKFLPYEIIVIDSKNILIKAIGTTLDFPNLSLILDLSKIKLTTGDVLDTQEKIYL